MFVATALPSFPGRFHLTFEGCAAKVQGDRKALVALRKGRNPLPKLRKTGRFVPAGTTKGLCGRPLETFAAHPHTVSANKNVNEIALASYRLNIDSVMSYSLIVRTR